MCASMIGVCASRPAADRFIARAATPPAAILRASRRCIEFSEDQVYLASFIWRFLLSRTLQSPFPRFRLSFQETFSEHLFRRTCPVGTAREIILGGAHEQQTIFR